MATLDCAQVEIGAPWRTDRDGSVRQDIPACADEWTLGLNILDLRPHRRRPAARCVPAAAAVAGADLAQPTPERDREAGAATAVERRRSDPTAAGEELDDP